MTAVATLEKSMTSRWTWQCFADSVFIDEDGVCAFSQRPTFDAALKGLAEHQVGYHLCPHCGGCGYDVNMDGTDNGACPRCKGHGIWLKAAERDCSACGGRGEFSSEDVSIKCVECGGSGVTS